MTNFMATKHLHLKKTFHIFYLKWKSRRLKKELSKNFSLYNVAISALRYVQQEHDRIVSEYHNVSRELENTES